MSVLVVWFVSYQTVVIGCLFWLGKISPKHLRIEYVSNVRWHSLWYAIQSLADMPYSKSSPIVTLQYCMAPNENAHTKSWINVLKRVP